jgi:lipopolysaccharide export system protein LptA
MKLWDDDYERSRAAVKFKLTIFKGNVVATNGKIDISGAGVRVYVRQNKNGVAPRNSRLKWICHHSPASV